VSLYYEAHITIDPVEGLRRALAEQLASYEHFKLAKLLMAKGAPSKLDTFMTGHATELKALELRTESLIRALLAHGFTVRRYKIEDCILDSRRHDVWGLL
jgi:hypothetical protein